MIAIVSSNSANEEGLNPTFRMALMPGAIYPSSFAGYLIEAI